MEIGGTHSVEPNLAEFKRPEKPPPFFGVDIDGTFYAQDGEAMKRNIEAFAKVREMGYTPFFCTGRSLVSTLRLLGDHFIDTTGYNGCPGVYNNGAIVYDEHGNIIFSSSFSREFLTTFYKFLTSKGLVGSCVFYTDNYEFSLVEVDDGLRSALNSRKLRIPDVKGMDEIFDMPIVGMSIVCDKLDIPGLKEGVDYVEKLVEHRFYDLSAPNITKAHGVMKLLEYYSVPPNACGYVGDGDNDVEVMELCKVSFAVGNASEEVKRHAKWILDKTCDEGAVADVLGRVYAL